MSTRSALYERYLRSPQWQVVRALTILRDGGRCRDCFSNEHWLDVHHLTYERLGRERLSDLVSLCRECHDARHQRKAQTGNQYVPGSWGHDYAAA